MDQINLKSVTNNSARNPIFQIVLIIVVLVLFGWFILLPKNNAYQEQSSQLVTLQTEKNSLSDDQERLNRLIAEMGDSDKEVKVLDEALPLSDRPTKIAVMLESYAQSSAMSLEQLNIADMDKQISAANTALLEDPYGVSRQLQTIKIDINVSGSIEQFRNFLTLLETSGRIIDISSFSVSSGDDAERFNLKLVTYAYEPQ